MQISKLSASGNDFLIFHTFVKKDYSKLAVELCDRHNGIGADGLIALLPHESCDIEWLFYNSDGSEANMCGNGTRASGLYAYTEGLCGAHLSLMTKAGVINLKVDGDVVQTQFSDVKIIKDEIAEAGLTWSLIDAGVPHLCAFVDEIDSIGKETLRSLRHKYNANVNLAVTNEKQISVRTFERGVEDETLACGTGMASVFYKANNLGLCDSSAQITPQSGEELFFESRGGNIFFKGKVKRVFDTIYNLKQCVS